MDKSNRIDMTLLEDKVIMEDGWYACAGYASGKAILFSADYRPPGCDRKISVLLCSGNGGDTWERYECDAEAKNCYVACKYISLPDGTLYGIDCWNAVQDKVRRQQPYKPFIMKVVRLPDSPGVVDDIANGRYDVDFVKVSIPDLSGGEGDSQNYTLGVAGQGLVEMDNGDLIMTMYGVFASDRVAVPYFPKGAFQARTWVCVSRDRGNSWQCLSTVASNDTCRLPETAEGYCEADLVKLNDGRLLCVMRTGGNPVKSGSRERYHPMVCCVSGDGGQNWSLPRALHPYGVYPRILQMKNGIIACVSGRPGFYMLLSADNGETWSNMVELAPDAYSDHVLSPSGYSFIAESEENVLTVLYDTVSAENGVVRHFVRMRKYRVCRA